MKRIPHDEKYMRTTQEPWELSKVASKISTTRKSNKVVNAWGENFDKKRVLLVEFEGSSSTISFASIFKMFRDSRSSKSLKRRRQCFRCFFLRASLNRSSRISSFNFSTSFRALFIFWKSNVKSHFRLWR